MIKAALIGVTGYGAFYLNQLLRLAEEEKVQLLGVVVRNPKEAKVQIDQVNKVGAKVFENTGEMYAALKNEIDLCCIPTELHSHARLTIEALEQGCNVLVEKPAAVTIQDIDAMRTAAQKADKKVLVGFQNIYDEDIQDLKRRLLGGELGEIRTIKMRGMWSRGSNYYSRNDWAGKMKVAEDWILDSPANNAFGHYINLMCFLGGSVFEESAKISSMQAELYRAMPIESCDTAFVKAQTSTGISLHYYITHACSEHLDPQIEIIGSEGVISWSLSNIDQSRMNMFDRVLDHLNGADGLVCDLDIAYSLTHCINAMHLAASIADVPETEYSVLQTDKGEQVVIANIGRVIQEAFEKELFPSEFNVSWAATCEEMDCKDLARFSKT